MYNVSITIEVEPYANREVTVTEDVSYGILHCEHVYCFVMPTDSGCVYCYSVVDGEQRSVDDPKELNYLFNKFGLDNIYRILRKNCSEDFVDVYTTMNEEQKHIVDVLMHIKTDYSPIYTPISNN